MAALRGSLQQSPVLFFVCDVVVSSQDLCAVEPYRTILMDVRYVNCR